MIWCVFRYDRGGDQFIAAEWPLATLDGASIAAAFGGTETEPMYEVTEAQRSFVESLIGEPLRFESSSYFLEAIATEDGETMICNSETIHLAPRDLPAFPDARRVAPRRSDL